MGIKTHEKLFSTIFFIFLILFLGGFGIVSKSKTYESTNFPKSSGATLPNKVYLFQAPHDTLLLENITLEQYYTYYIYVEIVTPYNCSIKITLWDPDGKEFPIFESTLFVYPEGFNYFETPFGTALGGDYDIEFNSTAPENVNIYIRIEKGPQSLYDKIPMEEVQAIRLYQVIRFSNDSISHNISFTTDYMYKFYVGRLSPISSMEDNEVKINLSIEDPGGIIYNIYINATLIEIDEVDRFKFGTAIGGLYSFTITIRSDVPNVNVGYSIIGLNQIGSGTEVNQTEPSNSTTVLNRYFSMPTEWTLGILGFAGTLVAIIGVVLYKQKRKSVISSDF